MDFLRLPVILKRYDFSAKMKISHDHSRDIMTLNGIQTSDKLVSKVLPWELETFALMSILACKEDDNQLFQGERGKRNFSKMITSIRNFQHPHLYSDAQNSSFLDNFMIVTGLTQFQIQESMYHKIYRYKYFFNFKNEEIDMKVKFREQFGHDFEEFLKLGMILNFLYGGKINDDRFVHFALKKYFPIVVQLTKDREKFIELQKRITERPDQYVYGFKYFYHYPFISHKRRFYMPLPHLILPAVTSSLLFRLTEGNGELRSVFGKEILENYILHICNLESQFDEVVPEFNYKHRKNNKRTLDVMIRKGDSILMMDSKSMAPRVSLRDLSKEAVEHTLNRFVESVVQVYRHITERLHKEYNPFSEVTNFEQKNIFGAVIIIEDSYVRRQVIMEKAAEALNIQPDTPSYSYLCSNIKVLSLYDLERMIFERQDIFRNLSQDRDAKERWFSYNLSSDNENGSELIDEINQLTKESQNIIREFIKDLGDNHLLPKK